LLAFGRRQPMDARVTNFNRIVQDNAEIMARLVGSAGQLEVDLEKKSGNVRADPTQFQQVLLNLVINARDALRDNGRITIRTSNREIKPGRSRVSDVPPGDYVCLTVTDNGTGMDAETQCICSSRFSPRKPKAKERVLVSRWFMELCVKAMATSPVTAHFSRVRPSRFSSQLFVNRKRPLLVTLRCSRCRPLVVMKRLC